MSTRTLVIVKTEASDFSFIPAAWHAHQETDRSAIVEINRSDLERLTPVLEANRCDWTLFEKRPRLSDYRLVAMDMDATTIQNETLDEMATIAGVGREVTLITTRAMRGELDYETALRARVALFKNFPETLYKDVIRERLKVQPHIERWLEALDALSIERMLISGGFIPVVGHFVNTLGFKTGFANTMTVKDGVFTGELEGDLVDSLYKKTCLEENAARLGIDMKQTIAIGDGANDIPMLKAAGLAIGFHPKPALIPHADIVLHHTGYETLKLFFATE